MRRVLALVVLLLVAIIAIGACQPTQPSPPPTVTAAPPTVTKAPPTVTTPGTVTSAPPTRPATRTATPIITTRLGWAPVDTPKSVLLFGEGTLFESIYVVANGSNELLVIDPKAKEADGSMRIVKRIAVGRSPFGLAQATAFDRQPIVAVGNTRDNTLTLINTITLRVVDTIKLTGSPARLEASGYWILTPLHDQGQLLTRSTRINEETHQMEVNTGPFDIAVNRKTGWIYTTSRDGMQITAVDKPDLVNASRRWWWLNDQVPYSIAVETVSGNLLVSVAADHNPDHPDRVLVIQPDYPIFKIIRTDQSCDSGEGGEIVADETGGYFIACTAGHEVWHVGPAGRLVEKIQTGKGPFGLDYSVKSHRLIVGSKVSGLVEVFVVK